MMHTSLAQKPQIQEFVCPNTDNAFRGLASLGDSAVWLSSNSGEVWFFKLGFGWENRSPQGYDSIQWRDIEAFNDSSALILSAGSPALVLRTEDYGLSWQETFRDNHPAIFYDAMDFWDSQRGVAFADAQNEYLGFMQTQDGGRNWKISDTLSALKVATQQGGFAASGTCIHSIGDSEWALVLGGPAALFIRNGPSLLKRALPLDHGAPSKGAFSLDFKSSDSIIAVGGDYRADSLCQQTIAISYNGGQNWISPNFPSHLTQRYWSCVQWQKNQIILCSRFGTALSSDNGKSWQLFDRGFYAVQGIWFSGPQGRLGRLELFEN